MTLWNSVVASDSMFFWSLLCFFFHVDTVFYVTTTTEIGLLFLCYLDLITDGFYCEFGCNR